MSRTLILADPAIDLEPLALREHWRPSGGAPAGHHDHAYRTWTTPDATTVRRIDHHGNGATVIVITGDGDAERVVEAIVAETAIVTTDELIDVLTAPSSTAIDVIRALRRLELAHLGDYADPPPLDPRYPDLITTLLTHSDRAVRLTTMLVGDELAAIWPVLREPVRKRHGVEVELAHIVEAFLVED